MRLTGQPVSRFSRIRCFSAATELAVVGAFIVAASIYTKDTVSGLRANRSINRKRQLGSQHKCCPKASESQSHSTAG
jgi:hypothetical protein